MINDKVVVGMGGIQISKENVPVYLPVFDQQGRIQFDASGAAFVKVAGGVAGGTVGRISGEPLKIAKSALVGSSTQGASFGVEYILLYPVDLEKYKTVGWFPMDHLHVIGELNRS